MTEFRSRRELREAERQGLVPIPEQVFDLPTGSIRLPEASEILTRKRIREMERDGLLDPLTGAITTSPEADDQAGVPLVESRSYDEVIAETEEPITASISAVVQSTPSMSQPVATPVAPPLAPPVASALKPSIAEPVAATDIFHSMAVDANARKPRFGIVLVVIILVLGGASAAAYMLGIFK